MGAVAVAVGLVEWGGYAETRTVAGRCLHEAYVRVCVRVCACVSLIFVTETERRSSCAEGCCTAGADSTCACIDSRRHSPVHCHCAGAAPAAAARPRRHAPRVARAPTTM